MRMWTCASVLGVLCLAWMGAAAAAPPQNTETTMTGKARAAKNAGKPPVPSLTASSDAPARALRGNPARPERPVLRFGVPEGK
jgi:hypothetical protein